MPTTYAPFAREITGTASDQGVRLEGWTQEGDGWFWSEPGGDNTCYLRELDGNWFYYEMEF